MFGVTNRVETFQQTIGKFVDEENLTNLDNIIVTRRDQAEHDKCTKRFLGSNQWQKLILNNLKSILSGNKVSVLGYEIGNGLVRPEKSRLQPLLDLVIPTKKISSKWVLGMLAYYAKWILQFSDCIQSTRQNSFHLM